MYLFLAFLLVPLIEIALFIQVGGLIGLWPTLAIVVTTAFIGTWLVRSQGRFALGQLQRSFSELNNPAEPLAHGAMILIAGALLLTPGFFTDAVGFALLMPPVRTAVFRYFASRIQVQSFQMGGGHRHPFDDAGGGSRNAAGDVIDGEFEDVTTKRDPDAPLSGWVEGPNRH